MEKLEFSKKKRSTTRSTLTKLITKIESILSSDLAELPPEQIEDLEELLDQLNDKSTTLKELDCEIGSCLKDEELDNDLAVSEDYNEKVVKYKYKINKILKRRNTATKLQPTSQISNASSDRVENESSFSKNGSKLVKLPKLSISKFYGDCSTWLDFWSQFESAIHDNECLTDVEKFSYLKCLLGGTAEKAVLGFALTSQNYESATKLLKQRFGRDDLVINAHMQRLLNLTPVKNSSDVKALRGLYDNCEIQIRSLEALKVTAGSYGHLLSPVLLKNLPQDISLEFNRKRESLNFDISELMNFFRNEVQCREASMLLSNSLKIQNNRSENYNKGDQKNKFTPTATTLSTVIKSCVYCSSDNHESVNCESVSLDVKREKLKNDGRCFKCFRKFHLASKCRIKMSSCEFCKSKYHHKSVCNAKNKNELPETSGAQEIINSVSHLSHSKKEVLLQTCSVRAQSFSKSKIVMCLLDSASHRSFITLELAQELKPKVIRKEKLLIYSFGAKDAHEKSYDVVQIKLENIRDSRRYIIIEALVTPIISACLFSTPMLDRQMLKKMEHFDVYDFFQGDNSKLHLLIGADYFWTVNRNADIRTLGRHLVAIQTLFGWSVVGEKEIKKKTVREEKEICKQNFAVSFKVAVREQSISDEIQKFFSLESLGILQDDDKRSHVDQKIITDFASNLTFNGKRYEAKLLWNEDRDELKNNYRIARNRFLNLKTKLLKNENMLKQYSEIIKEQERTGIIEECFDGNLEKSYFMPHRPVIRENKDTTKVRIVYDASSKERNLKSLNDCLASGPNLNPDILDLILKFRTHSVAFSADIEKAFHQIEICPEDRNYLKFIWLKDSDLNSVRIMRFRRLVFGVTCSPFILSATIKHHIKKYDDVNREVFHMLNSSLYVDDLFYGTATVDEAQRLSQDAVKILKDAGMHLRKFRTNSEELRSAWTKNEFNDCNSDYSNDNTSKILGINWDVRTDTIQIDLNPLLENLDDLKFTKREVLQIVAKIYDPIGLISPFIIRVKCLLQRLWEQGLEWDDELSAELKDEFREWCLEIESLKDLILCRRYFTKSELSVWDTTELHIFCDSSTKAFGSVAYFRYKNGNNYQTTFIMSKSRVAPLKKLTLPRLELMGGVIAARLAKYLKNLFDLPDRKVHLWIDSTIALCWIKGSAQRWKPFVSNRVLEIQEKTDPLCWKHCSGKYNAADCLTRGLKAKKLIHNELWWQGPSWLLEDKSFWPSCEDIKNVKLPEEERRSETKNTSVLITSICFYQPLLDLEKYSSLIKVLRVTAWVLRFINHVRKHLKQSGSLSAEEIHAAEVHWLRTTQHEAFCTEINQLNKKESLKNSPISHLSPIWDSEKLLRVGGRLQEARISDSEKHPFILPFNHRFTWLLAMQHHIEVMHGGIASTLAHIRERFNILKGRKIIKKVIKSCLICRKSKCTPGNEIFAPLPRDRICEAPPFENTGIDFAGPIYVKSGVVTEKAYVALFTCAITRAVHLELVSNLSTDNFILALRRFISRRGLCQVIYSDNAKTFIKADAVLKEIWQKISKSELQTFFATKRIVWKFIVPKASWWGGFYERMVRTVKTPLRKILGKACLTYEEIETVLTEVEAIVNSRPMTYLYEDNTEPSPLTPAHFLVGKRVTALPSALPLITISGSASTKKTLTKKLKYRNQLLEHFWNRWKKEYLLELRSAHQTKSSKPCAIFKVGDIVLIHDEKMPRHMWRYGRVSEIHQGRDNKVRSCTLKTFNGFIRRPIQLLYNLELNS